MQKLFAEAKELPQINQGGGLGGFANFTLGSFNQTVATIIGNIIGFLTIIAGLWFVINFILGAITWISAGGDKGKVKEAKDKITQAVIGLAVVVAAYTIAGLIGSILGLDFLNIGEALSKIKPTGPGTP